jgi:hypothetical protein
MTRLIRRREFVGGLGAAAVGPVVARAQQVGRVRRMQSLCYTPRTIRKGSSAQEHFFELVINAKSARALGLVVPLTLQVLPTR